MKLPLIPFAAILICWSAIPFASRQAFAQKPSGDRPTLEVRFEVFQKINLPAKSQGFLTKVNLEPGTMVQKGELLAELEIAKERLELKKLRAEIASLRGEIIKSEQAKKVSQLRVSELNKASTRTHIPRLEIVQADTDAKSAVASLTGAQANLHAKQAELELIEHKIKESTIVSPFDGIVFKQFKQPGEAVEQGETLAEIYRLDYVRGTVLLKQNEVTPQQFLAIKGLVEVEFPGRKTESFSFDKPQSLPRLDRDGRFLAVIKIRNKKCPIDNCWQLLPGMQGKLKQQSSTGAKQPYSGHTVAGNK